MINNIILAGDSYKVTHWPQYPPKTTNIYSYFESRGGAFNETVFFGLQYLLERLVKPITQADIDEAADLYTLHFGTDTLFNKAGWEYILNAHAGRLPVRIKAVPEGTVVGTHNVLMTVENTDPNVFWLTNYLETVLSQVWYPTTVATLSREIKKVILSYLAKTGDPTLVDFKLHDFGFRGVSSVESAAIGGLAHLVNFKGTDTVAALVLGNKIYGEKCAGFSIPASEHSTITSWGQEREVDAYRNMIEQYGDNPFYACVSDSYNIYKATENLWGTDLKAEVLNAKGTLVIRPDSGDPLEVLPKLLVTLGNRFGYTKNKKGFKVLNPKVRLIQGDGVDYDAIVSILEKMKRGGWSADNIAFGMGGALLQKLNRDTQKFAFKCSNAVIDGEDTPVFKEPYTDPGKNSKRGRLSLLNGETVEGSDILEDQLQTVFEDGIITKRYTLAEIRERAAL